MDGKRRQLSHAATLFCRLLRLNWRRYWIGEIDLLKKLYGHVIIPQAVVNEFHHPKTPPAVQNWIASPPTWIEIKAATALDPTIHLGAGETEAISLAMELGADQLLRDERKAIEIKKIKVAQPAMVAWCELEPLVATKGLEGGANATMAGCATPPANSLYLKNYRKLATARGFVVAGTLNILEYAAVQELIDLPTAIAKLQQTTFRAPADLVPLLLDRDTQRKLAKQSGA